MRSRWLIHLDILTTLRLEGAAGSIIQFHSKALTQMDINPEIKIELN